MAEYIEREALLELINEDCKYKNPTNEYTRGCNEVCDWAIKTIKNIPTADVVLRAELDAMRGAANSYKMHYENARQEIERLKEYNTSVAFKHYFDGRKTAIVEIFQDIATEMGALLPLCATRLIGGRSIGKSFELGREKALRDVIECIAKVQKKYTEGAAADGK